MNARTRSLLAAPLLIACGLTLSTAAFGAPPADPKAKALLSDLDKANTLNDVAQAFRKANLSQAELQALKPQLQGPLGTKIQRLIRQQKASSKSMLQASRERELRAFEAGKRKLLAKQEQARMKATQEVAAALARARASASKRPLTTMRMQAPPRPTPEPTGGTITSALPAPAVVGQRLTVAGTGFGASRGRAVLLVGPRERFTCDIASWSDTRVEVTVPLAAESLVRSGSQPGYIWLKLAGRESGPSRAIDVAPDLTRLTPEITGVTPSSLRAMQTFLIDGRNFGETQGRVVLQFRHGRATGAPAPDIDLDLPIDEWRDTYIYATLRWEADLRESQAVKLVVTNDVGQSVERTVEFTQEKEQYRLTRSLDRVHCELWDDHDDEPSWVCLAGAKNTQAFSWGRCSGGRVLSYGVTKVDEGGLGYGCRFVERPSGVNWSGSVEVWADLYSWVDCEVWLDVETVRGHGCG